MNKPLVFKPWMLMSVALGAALLIFNMDPIGDMLENNFGQGADMWAINIITISAIIYTLVKRK
ncbi:MAG: hypothetical protein AAB733_03845 [Patescibacteria group bacterium]